MCRRVGVDYLSIPYLPRYAYLPAEMPAMDKRVAAHAHLAGWNRQVGSHYAL